MINVPPAVIEITVEPKADGDREKTRQVLGRLAAEDPSLRVSGDNESSQMIIKGTDEVHLENIIDRLKREFKVEVRTGAPQVAYRETISQPVDVDYAHKKQTGGSGEYARVKIRLEPIARGGGFEFENAVIGGAVRKEYLPGVEKGVRASLEKGVLEGFPVIDLKVSLIDGAYHEVDSSALAFEMAARSAMKKGLAKAAPKLLEPVMRVKVMTPHRYMVDVIGDLNSRRGLISEQDKLGDDEVIVAMVPLVNMFGYTGSLKSLSRGEARFTLQFSHYEPLPHPDDDPFRPGVGMRI